VKEKLGIRWRDCGGTAKNRVRDGKAIAAEAVLDAVTVLLFLLSARAMLHDVFHWAGFHSDLCVGIVLAVICVSAMMRLSEQWQGLRRYIARGVILLVGLLGFLLYYIGRTAHEVFITTGLREVIAQYIDLWNEYYGTDIAIYGGIARNISAALDFCLVLIGFVLFWTAKLCDKKLITGILPALVFSAELMVGYAPKISGLLFFVFGIVTINVPYFKLPEFNRFPGKNRVAGKVRLFSWLPILLVVVLCSNILVYIASPYTDMIAANARPIRKTIQNWLSCQSGQEPTEPEEPIEDDNNGTSIRLTNKMPAFKDIPVITFVMSGPAQGSIYLKDFSAGKYTDGLWDADIDSFENYFRGMGCDPDLVAKELLKREVDALAKSYGAETLTQNIFGKTMHIWYLENYTGRMAVPYFAELKDDAHIQAIGAGYYTRTEDVSSVSVEVWVYENDYVRDLARFENPESPLTAWGYDSYVGSHYLDVPEEMDTVRTLAASLYSGKGMLDADSENELRLYKADLVADWLEKNTAYSVYLPDVPQGQDPIEYFLGGSEMGYCMHYASASVMLLRQMGVPARIATGYIVPKENVSGISINVPGNASANYWAQVIDKQAHAWVEIYLDGMGWFPVEVTKGFRSTDPNAPPDDDPPETTGVTEPTVDDTEPEPTENTQETYVDDTKNTTPNESVIPTGNIDPVEPEERTHQAIIIVCAVLLMMTGVVVVLKLRYNYRDKLRGLICRRKASLAIWMMNRRIYRKLRRTGKIIRFNLRDADYEEILKKNYPDIPAEAWERYMELVKAASFSMRAFSDEEVAFCYEIYRKVKLHS